MVATWFILEEKGRKLNVLAYQVRYVKLIIIQLFMNGIVVG